MFQSPTAPLTNFCQSTRQRGELSLASICAALWSQWHLQIWHSSTTQQPPAEASGSHLQDVFIHYSADNRQGTQGTSWQANKLSLTSLSKFHFNVQFLALLRAQSLLKIWIWLTRFFISGISYEQMPYESRLHFKEEFHKPVNYSACKRAEGQQPLGSPPQQPVTRRTSTFGEC